MTGGLSHRTLVSAHEYASKHRKDGATAAVMFAEAVELTADYIEFDVQRTRDGVFVVNHDRETVVAGERRRIADLTLDELRASDADVLTYAEALGMVRGRAGAHLDLKFRPPASSYAGPDDKTWEVQAARYAVEALGADKVVVTTGRDRAVAALARWSATSCPDLLVGLSLGGSKAHLPWRRRISARWSELFPARRVAACGARVVVANHYLARLGVARWTGRHELLLLVWTVDSRGGLRRWLYDPRCWMVTTNNVRAAVRIRDGYRD